MFPVLTISICSGITSSTQRNKQRFDIVTAHHFFVVDMMNIEFRMNAVCPNLDCFSPISRESIPIGVWDLLEKAL